MILYFAACQDPPEGGRVLLSFAQPRPVERFINANPSKRLFLDSGAFTAWSRGQTINLEEYAAFIKRNQSGIEVAANLDVIDSSDGTWRNQQALEALGVQVLPVIHIGEPMSVLDRILSKYDHFAVGGLVPYLKVGGGSSSKAKAIRFLDNVFSRSKGRKIHGFGVNDPRYWMRYPFYSVDATSWQNATRYGQMFRFDGSPIYKRFRSKDKERMFEIGIRPGDKKESLKHNQEMLMRAVNTVTDLWRERGVFYQG